MSFLLKILFLFIVYAAALFLAHTLLPGFTITELEEGLALLALALTGIELLIKPLIRFVLSPFIALTFGLLHLVINGIILYGLDFFYPHLIIEGPLNLLYATLLITALGFFGNATYTLFHKSS